MMRKKRVLTLGGCVQVQLFAGMGDYFEWNHIWRPSIPTLSPEEVDLGATCHSDPIVNRFVEREAKKIAYRTLRDSEHDIIMLGIASDFNAPVIRVGESFVLNPANAVFGPEFAEIDLAAWPALAAGELLTADDPAYDPVWRRSFARLYDEVLRKHLSDGKQIYVFEQYLCEAELRNGKIRPIDGLEHVQRTNRILLDRYDYVSGFGGIRLFKTPLTLSFTSNFAPHGKMAFHPTEEIYNYYQFNLLRQSYPEDDFSDDFLISNLQKIAVRLDSASTALRDTVRQRDEHQLWRTHYEAERLLAEASKRSIPLWGRFASAFVRSGKWRLRWERGMLERAGFDRAAYLARYSDVDQAGLDPILHYLLCGRAEGRVASIKGQPQKVRYEDSK